MIEALFAYLNKQYPKAKKHVNSKVIIGLVICLILSVVTGAAFYVSKQKSQTAKKVQGTYAKIENEYDQAVTAMSQTPAATETYKKKYKNTYNAASIVVNHIQRYKLDTDQLKLKQVLRDIDDDGIKELIICYQKKDTMVITGIYRYNTKSEQAINIDFIENIKKYVNTTLSNTNTFVVMNVKHKGIAYKYTNHQLKIMDAHVTNAERYLKKHGASPITLKSYTITPSQTDKSSKVYKVINEKLDTTQTIRKYDLDGDGKKDTMSFQYAEDYSDQPYKLIINGNTFTLYNQYINADVYLLRARNGSTYLLTSFNEDDNIANWMLYSYSQGTLKKRLSNTRFHNGNSEKSHCWTFINAKMTGNQLVIQEGNNSTFMSFYSFTSTYLVNYNHVDLLSSRHPIQTYNGENSLNTKYMVLKTSNSFAVYTNCTKKAFTIPQGVNVHISAVYINEKFDVYEILYNNKIGYIKNDVTELNPETHPYFADLVVGG